MFDFSDVVINFLAALVALAAPVAGVYGFKILRAAAARVSFLAASLVDGQKEYLVGVVIQATEEAFASFGKPYVKSVITAAEKKAGKLEYAIVKVVDLIPGISTKEAEVLVHANLAKLGAGARGFVADLTKAVQTDDAPKG